MEQRNCTVKFITIKKNPEEILVAIDQIITVSMLRNGESDNYVIAIELKSTSENPKILVEKYQGAIKAHQRLHYLEKILNLETK